MQTAWSTGKLRDSPELLDAWPDQSGGLDSHGLSTEEDNSESLVDCFLLAKDKAADTMGVILTLWRGQERIRNLRFREEGFAAQLCNFLQTRKGMPILEIGNLVLDFA